MSGTLYTYRCPTSQLVCGHEWTEFRPSDDRNEPATCPECGDTAGRRVWTAPRQAAIPGIPNVVADELTRKRRKTLERRDAETRRIRERDARALR